MLLSPTVTFAVTVALQRNRAFDLYKVSPKRLFINESIIKRKSCIIKSHRNCLKMLGDPCEPADDPFGFFSKISHLQQIDRFYLTFVIKFDCITTLMASKKGQSVDPLSKVVDFVFQDNSKSHSWYNFPISYTVDVFKGLTPIVILIMMFLISSHCF